jgi:hypothetical protein
MTGPSVFWREKYALQCGKALLDQQLSPYTRSPRSSEPPRTSPTRGTLHPVRPIPILAPPDGPVTLSRSSQSEAPGELLVGIIGAGAAGLYTAMILDDLGIKYEILEGSDRIGGRIFTHDFNKEPTKGNGEWNYFVRVLYPLVSAPLTGYPLIGCRCHALSRDSHHVACIRSL